MKKKLIILSMAVILLITTAVSLQGESTKRARFYLKVKGIQSFSKGGDFDAMMMQNELYYTDLEERLGSYYDIVLESKSNFQGFGGEIGIEVQKYALGFSIGSIKREFSEAFHYQGPNKQEDFLKEYSFSALPIFVYLHYKIIDKPFIKSFFTLGQGVYIIKYEDVKTRDLTGYSTNFSGSGVKIHGTQLGFYVGATIDLNVTRNIALSFDAGYRFVGFDELEGEEYFKTDTRDELYEGEIYYSVNKENDLAYVHVGENTGENWESLPFKLNLNGFVLTAGVKIIL